MKVQLAIVTITILMFSSCMKTKTCTCTYPDSNEVYSVTSKQTNSKKDLKTFEDQCKNQKLSVTTEDGFGNSNQTIYSDVCKIN